MITSRSPLAKVLRSLDKFWQWLRTAMAPEVGLKLQVECPTCKELVELDQLLEWGNLYEFDCPTCKTKFTVFIPPYVVRPGTIEATYEKH